MRRKGMGKKTLIMGVLTAFLSVGLLAGLSMAVDEPDTIKIYMDGFGEHKKGPVEFTHKKHTTDHGVKCADCHHVYQDGQNTWKEGDPVEKCEKCHDFEKKQDKAANLKNAFHANCKECHKSLGKGPFKQCNECHGEK